MEARNRPRYRQNKRDVATEIQLKELSRTAHAAVRRRTLSQEVFEAVHVKKDERRHLGTISSQSEQIRHPGRSIKFNGTETVAKISHEELLIM